MTPEILLVGTNESNKLFAETLNEFSGQEDADYLSSQVDRPPHNILIKKLPLPTKLFAQILKLFSCTTISTKGFQAQPLNIIKAKLIAQ